MKNPLKDGVLTENSVGIGTVTRAMIRARAFELAALDSRSAQQVSSADWAQARRELTGTPNLDPQEAALGSVARLCRSQNSRRSQRR
jgi:hypothetical protein